MGLIRLELPDGRIVPLSVQDGFTEIDIKLKDCACGCGDAFYPVVPHQQYINEMHEQAQRNKSRRKDPERKYKPRKAS